MVRFTIWSSHSPQTLLMLYRRMDGMISIAGFVIGKAKSSAVNSALGYITLSVWNWQRSQRGIGFAQNVRLVGYKVHICLVFHLIDFLFFSVLVGCPVASGKDRLRTVWRLIPKASFAKFSNVIVFLITFTIFTHDHLHRSLWGGAEGLFIGSYFSVLIRIYLCGILPSTAVEHLNDVSRAFSACLFVARLGRICSAHVVFVFRCFIQ